ncbi:hypothetical protein BDV12DRAFT_208913 [Aspergillus spectabilis]
MAPNNSEILFGLLPVEIWTLIVDFLQWESWTTLHSLNLACGDSHPIVSPVLFKNICIRFPGRRQTSHVFKKDNKHERLHELLEPENGVKSHLYLVESLPNLEIIRLTGFRWRGIPFPPHLFRIVKTKQPSPLFYYEGGSESLVKHEILLGAPYIKSLNITINHGPNAKNRPDTNALGDVILSFPNLERLVLTYNPGIKILSGTNCSPRPIFDLPPDGTLPPLRVPSFANFSFTSEQAAAWARCLSQQDLQHLALDRTTEMTGLIDHLSGAVAGLTSLAIRIHDATKPEFSHRVITSLDRLLQAITELTAFLAHDLPKEVLHSAVVHHNNHPRQLPFRYTRSSLLDIYFTRLTQSNPIGVRRSREDSDTECIFSSGELRGLAERLPLVERLGNYMRFSRNMNLHEPESRTRFVGLDVKGREWESFPWDANTMDRRYFPFVFACWCEEGVGVSKMHQLRLEFQAPWRVSFIEQNKFEQTMYAAGLRDSSKVDFGPRIW